NRLIEIEVIGELLREADETIFVSLSNPINGVLGVTHAVGTILNDDGNTQPAIVRCAANRVLGVAMDCKASLPDMTGEIAVSDPEDAVLAVTQFPPAGALLGVGVHLITFNVVD